MKKNLTILKTVFLFLFTVFLLQGCRTENLSEEHNHYVTKTLYDIQNVPQFSSFISRTKNKKINSNKSFKSVNDNSKVLVIEKPDITSYSTLIYHEDLSFEILVYSINKNGKESFYKVKYLPEDKFANNKIENFTGKVEFSNDFDEIFQTVYFNNGVVDINKKSRSSRTSYCHYYVTVTAVNCTAGEDHSPGEACRGTADQQPYYDVYVSSYCNQEQEAGDFNGGSASYGEVGDYGGGGGGFDVLGLIRSKTDDYHWNLFNQLDSDNVAKIAELVTYNTFEDGMYNFIISFFSQNPNTTIEQFQKWLNWYDAFKNSNPNVSNYFAQHPEDLEIIFFPDFDPNNSEEMSILNSSANVFTEFLINENNNTTDNLSINWPNLESLKQKIKDMISKGIYTTAGYARKYLVEPSYIYAGNNPSKIAKANKFIVDPIRMNAVAPLVNFNPNSMSWADLFNIWFFELTPGHFSNNTINFTNASNVVNGSNIYNPTTNAVKNFPEGNSSGSLLDIQYKLANGIVGVGQTTNGYFKYDVNAFYSTLANVNIGIQMLGSFPITAKVISKSGNTAVIQFTINNDLGWESATRFIKGENGSHQGVIDNKGVGIGIHLGGTITNIFTWTETINF